MTYEKAISANEPARPIGRPENDKLKGTMAACNRVYQKYLDTLKLVHKALPEKLPKEPIEALVSIVSALQRVTDVGENGHAARCALQMMQEIAAGETTIDPSLGFDWTSVVVGLYPLEIMKSANLEALRA